MAINPTTPRFEMFPVRNREENFVLMLSQDEAFLHEKWQLIAEWAKKIDPKVVNAEYKIEYVEEDNERFKKGTPYCSLHEILPRPVNALYGSHIVTCNSGNCHSAALVAAGVFPAMISDLAKPSDFSLTTEKMEKVKLDQLSSGDMIFLQPRDMSVTRSHSFVFLDHDISFTMNGRGQNFEIATTESILQLYGAPLDALKGAPSDDIAITLFRKKPEWHYPEEIMTTLDGFYKFANDRLSYMLSGDCNYSKLDNILETLYRFSENPHQTNAEKEASTTLFYSVKKPMPGSATSYFDRRHNLNPRPTTEILNNSESSY